MGLRFGRKPLNGAVAIKVLAEDVVAFNESPEGPAAAAEFEGRAT
jgi:hypothetical protein